MEKDCYGRFLKSWLFLFVLFHLGSPAWAQPSIAARWEGKFYYASGDKRLPVAFTWELQANGTAIAGRSTEPATFGNGSASFLYAKITGTLQGMSIVFTKTYDGTAGVSHAVQYVGEVTADGTGMSGTWRIGTATGKFQATRR